MTELGGARQGTPAVQENWNVDRHEHLCVRVGRDTQTSLSARVLYFNFRVRDTTAACVWKRDAGPCLRVDATPVALTNQRVYRSPAPFGRDDQVDRRRRAWAPP